jgi:hypothetical protein
LKVILDEEPIKEIHLANLTDWGWMLFFSIVILVVWLLIVFQANSKGSHEYGQVSNSEIGSELGKHGSSDKVHEIAVSNDYE